MSTGFWLGIKYKDGKYKIVECASGSSLEDSGRILYFSYNTKEKVETLLTSGFGYLEDYEHRKFIQRIPQWRPEEKTFLGKREVLYYFDEEYNTWKTSDGEDLGSVLERAGLDKKEQYEADLRENPLYRGCYKYDQLLPDVQRRILNTNSAEIERVVITMELNRAFFLDDLKDSYGISCEIGKNSVCLKFDNTDMEKERNFLSCIMFRKAFSETDWDDRTNNVLNEYIRNCNLERINLVDLFGITSDLKLFLKKDTIRDDVLYVYEKMNNALEAYKNSLEEKILDLVVSTRKDLPELSDNIVRCISHYFYYRKKVYFSESGEEIPKSQDREETMSPSL